MSTEHADRLLAVVGRQRRGGKVEEKGKGKWKQLNAGISLAVDSMAPTESQQQVAPPPGAHPTVMDPDCGFTASGKFKVGQYLLDSQKLQRIDTTNSTSTVACAQNTEDEVILARDLHELGKLGQGNGGVVLLVQHVPTEMRYALKIIPIGPTQDTKAVEQEIAAIDTLVHPNLVRTLTAFVKSRCVHIVQEYMDKGSLADLMSHTKSVPEPVLANMAHQILLGLNHLHTEIVDGPGSGHHSRPVVKKTPKPKLIHRDLKPANILWNSVGEVKVADFGIAAQVQTKGRSTFVGTSMYMSPERIKGARYNHKSDIWAFGLTLVELACGVSPFKAKVTNFIELLLEITSTDRLVLPDSLSPGLKDLIWKCLAQEPDERPSAAELLSHPWLECACTRQEFMEWAGPIPSKLPRASLSSESRSSWGGGDDSKRASLTFKDTSASS